MNRPDRDSVRNATGYLSLLQLAWPIILANSSAPLLGLVDTAVIGHTGNSAQVGALALGGLIFGFMYWSMGFLRMGTTGFTARADGAGDESEIRAAAGRALLLGLGIGAVFLALQWPLLRGALLLLGGSEAVEGATAEYFAYRIWGAPAALGSFALMGLFIGLGKSGYLLAAQLFLNGLNVTLDLWFAGWLGWGVAGVGLGTALAEWAAFGLSLWLAWRLLGRRHNDALPFLPLDKLRDSAGWRATLRANSDIMLRTLLMLAAFSFFINSGAGFGDAVLAANHILLQLISLSAFFLDGFANATEPMVGRAAGQGNLRQFDRAARRSLHLAAVTAMLLATLIAAFGPLAVGWMTDLTPLRVLAGQYMPFCAIYVLLSFGAFQLDGIFIGTSRTAAMRNMSLLSVAVFLAAGVPAAALAGNTGLWICFILYVAARAVTLAFCMPALRRDIRQSQTASDLE
jgi:MATE family multidrug resistance protein